MNESKLLLWLGVMVPIVFSAGPANITMASLAGKFGFARLLPFIAGINVVVLSHALLIGFGAGSLIEAYPIFFHYFQYAGSAYLLYLAYRLFRSSQQEGLAQQTSSPRFVDGVMLQSFNVKIITVTVVMFSQFLDTNTGQLPQTLALSFGIATLTTGATMSWAYGGALLSKTFASDKSSKVQGYFFGMMLLGVSIWMLFN